eukprot:2181843-Pleurochrysis_carterae.AAC.1
MHANHLGAACSWLPTDISFIAGSYCVVSRLDGADGCAAYISAPRRLSCWTAAAAKARAPPPIATRAARSSQAALSL